MILSYNDPDGCKTWQAAGPGSASTSGGMDLYRDIQAKWKSGGGTRWFCEREVVGRPWLARSIP
jgi:hypothetical protein